MYTPFAEYFKMCSGGGGVMLPSFSLILTYNANHNLDPYIIVSFCSSFTQIGSSLVVKCFLFITLSLYIQESKGLSILTIVSHVCLFFSQG